MGDSKRIYGIDLGTTYSCLAYVDEHGKPVVVENKEGQLTTPSVVYFESPDNIVVGKHAKDVAVLHPDRVVSTVKRVMGDPTWIFECDGKTYRPQNISSFILRKLVDDAQDKTGDTISDVVITCPAYFGVEKREATKQAGILAGLNVRYVIPEPTAAAYAYGIKQSEEQTVLVFDLGGGTFDVTVMEVKANEINAVCVGGDWQLGGKDWDETIATWFAEQFSSETGIAAETLTNDPETWQELLKAAEDAKVALSNTKATTHKIWFDTKRAAIELKREKFNELTAHWLERAISLTKELLATAEAKGYSKIDKILLVGGSTYMPQVVDAVKARFPIEVCHYNPNQAVAMGAAQAGFQFYLNTELKKKEEEFWKKAEDEIKKAGGVVDEAAVRSKAEQLVAQEHGMTLQGLRDMTRRKIRNVTSKSFGIVVVDKGGNDVVQNLIVVNDVVPRSHTETFGTHEDGQDGVLLRCVENTYRVGAKDKGIDFPALEEEQETAGLKVVGTVEVRFKHSLPRESPVKITLSLTEDCLLTVHGKDLTTNEEAVGEFKAEGILTAEELKEEKSRMMAITVT